MDFHGNQWEQLSCLDQSKAELRRHKQKRRCRGRRTKRIQAQDFTGILVEGFGLSCAIHWGWGESIVFNHFDLHLQSVELSLNAQGKKSINIINISLKLIHSLFHSFLDKRRQRLGSSGGVWQSHVVFRDLSSSFSVSLS